MSNQNKLPYPVRPLYPAVPATDVTPSYQPPPSASMNPYPENNPGPYPPGGAANPSPYPPPSSSVYPTNPITYPPIDPTQASVYPPNNPGAAAAPLNFNPYPPQNPNVYPSNPSPYPPVGQNNFLPGYPPNNPGAAPPAFNPNPYPSQHNPNVYPSNPVPYPPIDQNPAALSGNMNPSEPSLYPPLDHKQTPGYPNPSAPPLDSHDGTEPPVNLFNFDVNEGGKSKFMKGVMDSALQLAKDGAAKYVPSIMDYMNKGPNHDMPDGNCFSSSSEPKPTKTEGIHSHFKSGEGSIKKWCGQDYKTLKRNSKSQGVLFEDPQFPASNRLLVDDKNQYIISYFGRSAVDSNSIEWLRPHEICQRNRLPSPQMFVQDADRFDINQGEIGNCWFLAAVANLAENKKCFDRVVPSGQNFDHGDYAGIFRFRFWRFGEWIEIVIDDRLPTRNGKLIYLRSVEKHEFWGALLEKAYAKLHGSYKALEGGLTIEAAVDFTGGIPELIDLERTDYSQERLFYIMSKADSRDAFMGCALTSNSRRAQQAQNLGLQSRHAYTITKVVEIRSHKVRGGIPLVRLRNPHGNSKEWRGDWSDGDRNWKMIPNHRRTELGLTFEDDGEFYMSFRDFLLYFGELEICHLTPDSYEDNDSRKKFEVFHFYGEWNFGSTAGGCGNDGNRAFAKNPQFFINLNDPDPYDDVTQCPVVISLMQRQKKRKCEHAIGFKIFKCDQTAKNLDEQYFRYHSSTDRTGTFINLREVSKRTLLPEGRYCIIPCTFKQGEEGNFLLRVFVEKKWGSSQGGRRHAVNDAMDSGATGSGIRNIPIQIEKTYGATDSNSIVDGVQNIDIKPGKSKSGGFLKPKRITGFALKQLEKNFPKGTKHLKEFYNWSKDRDSEFNLLQKISKSL